jgi:Calcineurin-like phosphoesterase
VQYLCGDPGPDNTSGEHAAMGSCMQRLWTRRACLVALPALAISALAISASAASVPIHRIVSVGDVHGDFSAWRGILRAAKLVDDRGRWTGGRAILVQVGDAVDRGPDSLKIVEDLIRLQREARRAGGQVIALVGNHEAMNVTGDYRYVSPEDYKAYVDSRSVQRRENVYATDKPLIEETYRRYHPDMTDDEIEQAWFGAVPLGSIEHRIAWDPGGKIGKWIVQNPAIVLLDGTLFVHGGISPAYAHMPIDEINRRVHDALLARATDLQSIINDPVGPLWYRGLATPNVDEDEIQPAAAAGGPATPKADANAGRPPAETPAAPPEPPVEEQLKVLLPFYGAKRIVIGHTPILSGIEVLYGGELIRIDTGISRVFGGKLTYLDIVDGTPIPHVVEKSQPLMK